MASLSLPIFGREALSRLDRRLKAEKASGLFGPRLLAGVC